MSSSAAWLPEASFRLRIDIVFPVLVDGSRKPARIEGAVYGRSLEVRGNVAIDGPVVARGDMRLSPGKGAIQLSWG